MGTGMLPPGSMMGLSTFNRNTGFMRSSHEVAHLVGVVHSKPQTIIPAIEAMRTTVDLRIIKDLGPNAADNSYFGIMQTKYYDLSKIDLRAFVSPPESAGIGRNMTKVFEYGVRFPFSEGAISYPPNARTATFRHW